MSLLETIKKHDAKMEALTRTNDRLETALMQLVDDLIDKNMTLCLDQQYITEAVQMLKNRRLMDSHRSNSFEVAVNGDCKQSRTIKHAVKTLNSSYTL